MALLIAAALTAVFTWCSTAGAPVPMLAWIAPAPILAFAFTHGGIRLRADATRGTSRRVVIAAFLAVFVGNLAWVALYRGILPGAPLAGFAFLFGAAFAMAVWLTAWTVSRRGAWAGVLLFPSVWTAFEFAVSRWSPHGTAGSLAYSQADVVPLVQLAAWTGLSGITFLVQAVAAGVAASVGGRTGRGIRWPLLAVPAAALLIAFALGAWRLRTLDDGTRVPVGLVSVDQGMARFDTTARDEAMPVVVAYRESVSTLAGRRVDAIVMPEKMVGVAPGYEEDVSSLLASASDQHQVLIVAGLNLVGRTPARNVAAIFSRGRRVLDYDKRHLVPGLEATYTPGTTAGVYQAPGGTTGIAICKDMDFPDVGRDYSRAGVGLLFVPAWDFTRDAWLHSRMAVMRGVEGGYSVARAAADGLLTGSDHLGRVIAERPSSDARASMLFINLPLGRGKTFYGEHGDWFAWTAALAAALVIGAAATRQFEAVREQQTVPTAADGD
jgi:apolipoprotein N-acyltransferase